MKRKRLSLAESVKPFHGRLSLSAGEGFLLLRFVIHQPGLRGGGVGFSEVGMGGGSGGFSPADES